MLPNAIVPQTSYTSNPALMPPFVPYLHLFLRCFFLLSKALFLSLGTWTRAQELSQSITHPSPIPCHHFISISPSSVIPRPPHPAPNKPCLPPSHPSPQLPIYTRRNQSRRALSTANISEGANPQSAAVSTQNQRQFSMTSGSARDSERKALARPRANSRQNAHACT